MKNKIVVKNRMDLERFLEYNKFHYYHITKIKRSNIIFSLGLVLMIVSFSITRDYYYLVLSGILGFFLLLFNTMYKSNAKRLYNSYDKEVIEAENTFEFLADEIKVLSKKFKNSINYTSLYLVAETNNAFYIYISKLQAFVIAKNDLKAGDIDKLKELLRTKISVKKYKVYNYGD